MSPKLLAFALTFAAFASPYAATAQTPPATTTPIISCVNVYLGTSRIVNSANDCIKPIESPLVYNQTGDQGPQGPQGVAGPRGTQGNAGAPGATGLAGPIGATGLAGATGMAGAPGLQGPQGQPGATGLAGPQGPSGTPGPVGPTGLAGSAGPTGPQGVGGAPGGQVYASNSLFGNNAGYPNVYVDLFGPVTGPGTLLAPVNINAITPSSLPIPLACNAGNFAATVSGAAGQSFLTIFLQTETSADGASPTPALSCTINVPTDGSTTTCTAPGSALLQPGSFASIRVGDQAGLPRNYVNLTNANLFTSFTCN